MVDFDAAMRRGGLLDIMNSVTSKFSRSAVPALAAFALAGYGLAPAHAESLFDGLYGGVQGSVGAFNSELSGPRPADGTLGGVTA